MLFEHKQGSIIKVIGVGGGGSNAVAYMYQQGIIGVDFAICNTDKQALDCSSVPTKIQLGPSLTEGMGAGSDPEIGKQSCIESIDDVRRFLEQDTKMLFVTAGMGGGTGTGAAPIIAKAAKEMGILTVAIVTLPFKFEGLPRRSQAMEGLEQLKKNVDSILVISNDRLRTMFGNLSLSMAFSKADDVLTTAAKGIAEIITVPGQINVDFKDVNTVMRDSGVAIMSYSEVGGEDRARKAIEEAVNSPLLEDNDIRGAQNILLNISTGKREVTMDEFGEITNYLQEEAGYGTQVIWGHCKDASLDDVLRITLIATGFEDGQTRANNEGAAAKIVVPLDEPFDIDDEKVAISGHSEGEKANTIDFDEVDVRKTKVNLAMSHADPFISKEQKHNQTNPRTNQSEMDFARREYLRNSRTKPLDSPKIISEMEDIPAYKRRNVELDQVRESDNGTSKLSIGFDDTEGPVVEGNNRYLHDNVD